MSAQELSNKNLSGAQAGWNEAISEAKRQMGEHLRRVRRLKAAIRAFEELRNEGASFPVSKQLPDGKVELKGESGSVTPSERCHKNPDFTQRGSRPTSTAA